MHPRTSSAACALALALLLSSCPSGLTSIEATVSTAPEGAPASVASLGLDLAMVLVDPATGLALDPQIEDVVSDTVNVEGAGTYTFFCFSTKAKAHDANGLGVPLDRDTTQDDNNASDIFLAALDSFGDLKDVVLVSRAGAPAGGCDTAGLSCRAGNGASGKPSIAYLRNPFVAEPTGIATSTPGLPAMPCANGTHSPPGYVRVAFESTASDLVQCQGVATQTPQDLNGAMQDIFLASVHVYVVDGVVDLRLYTPQCDYGDASVCNQFPTEIVSWSALTSTVWADGASFNPALSPDGLSVAFESDATNLVAGDSNRVRDVFRRPMPRPIPNHGRDNPPPPNHFFVGAFTTQGPGPGGFCYGCHGNKRETTRMSKPLPPAIEAGGASFHPRFYLGGGAQFITFESEAGNLVAGDTNGVRDVFYGKLNGIQIDQLFRASVRTGGVEAFGGASRNPSLAILDASATPPVVRVAFESDATDLVDQRPASSTTNAYLFDSRDGGTTTLLNQRIGPAGAVLGSVQGGAPADSFRPELAADGSSVVFETRADNLDYLHPHDQNGVADVVIADLTQLRSSGDLRVQRLSVTPLGGDADGASSGASIGTFTPAPSGSVEAFTTHLLEKVLHPRCVNCHGFNSNPRPSSFPANHQGDTTGGSCTDCHCETQTGVQNWHAPPASLSFHDKTPQQLCDQLKLDDPAGDTALEHLLNDPRIKWALGDPSLPTPCWVPTPGGTAADCNGTNSKPSVPGGIDGWNTNVNAWNASHFACEDFSAQGGTVVGFTTQATNLGAPAGGPVLAFPRTSRIERVSKTSGYAPEGGRQVKGASRAASISRDDRYVAFVSVGALSPLDTNGLADVYVRDLYLGTTVLVSHAAGLSRAGNGACSDPSVCIDAQGRAQVVFESRATNLVAGFVDRNGGAKGEIYRAELGSFDPADAATIPVSLVSASTASSTQGGNGGSARPRVAASGAGVLVAFESAATDLVAGFVDANGSGTDVFLRDEAAGTATLVSHASAGALEGGSASSARAAISDDGSTVAFESLASNLIEGFVDGGTGSDVYRARAGVLELISGELGSATQGGDGSSGAPALDAKGETLAFESSARLLIEGFVDANGSEPDVYVWNGTVTLVSRDASLAVGDPPRGGNHGSFRPSLGPQGTPVLFDSLATNLVGGDVDDLVLGVYQRDGTQLLRLSESVGGAPADGPSARASIGSAHGAVVFETSAANLAPNGVDTNGLTDIYRRGP